MTDDPFTAFDDLLDANRAFASDFRFAGTPGVAGAGVVMVTCMDSRIDPLSILGLTVGDLKVVRNPGGRVTESAMEALVLSVHLLEADKIMIVPHTRCAMGSSTEEQFHERISASAGQDSTWLPVHAVADQEAALREDVARVRSHPLVPESVAVGGFVYDVDTGLLEPVA